MYIWVFGRTQFCKRLLFVIKYLLLIITIYLDKLEVLRKTRFWGPQSRPSSLTLSSRNILNSYTPNNQHFQKFQISKNLESFHFTERERWQTNWLLSLVQPFCEKSNNLLTCLTTTRNTYNVSGRTKVCGENLNIHAKFIGMQHVGGRSAFQMHWHVLFRRISSFRKEKREQNNTM